MRSVHDCSYTIAAARPRDLPLLGAIELAAARLLTGRAPEAVLATSIRIDVLAAAQREGRLFVALHDDRPVGFAHVELIEARSAHLEELDVHPDHGRRGIGRTLVMAVCAWAEAAGMRWVTLSTFKDVPFNAPFYARLGFQPVPSAYLSPALRAVVDAESDRGLDRAARVVMRRSARSTSVFTSWAS